MSYGRFIENLQSIDQIISDEAALGMFYVEMIRRLTVDIILGKSFSKYIVITWAQTDRTPLFDDRLNTYV